MAKLILVIDIGNTADALVADHGVNDHARFTVKTNSGRRSKAFLGRHGEVPHENVFEGPKTTQVVEAYVTDSTFTVQGVVVPVKCLF